MSALGSAHYCLNTKLSILLLGSAHSTAQTSSSLSYRSPTIKQVSGKEWKNVIGCSAQRSVAPLFWPLLLQSILPGSTEDRNELLYNFQISQENIPCVRVLVKGPFEQVMWAGYSRIQQDTAHYNPCPDNNIWHYFCTKASFPTVISAGHFIHNPILLYSHHQLQSIRTVTLQAI